MWAKRIIPERNKLMAADAERLDEAFHVRLRSLPAEPPSQREASDGSVMAASKQSKPKMGLAFSSIDKSTLSWPEPRRFAIVSTSSSLRNIRAWYAVASRPMRTICVLHKVARSAVKSAMNLRSHSVAGTIAKFIAVAMRRVGGEKPD